MTDPTPRDDELDLLSAYIDGEATPDEEARVESDERLSARGEELRARARALTPDAPAGLVDVHVGAALEAFDERRAPGSGGAAPVTPLAARARRPWYERVPLPAIAATFLLVALVGALALIPRDHGDDMATSADEAATLDVADDAGEGTGGAAESAGDTSAQYSATRRSFASTDEFADYVRALTTPAPQVGTTGADGATAPDAPDASADDTVPSDDGAVAADRTVQESGCDAVAAANVEPDTVEAVVAGTVDGRDVTGVVTPDGDGRRLVVIDDATCAVVDDREL